MADDLAVEGLGLLMKRVGLAALCLISLGPLGLGCGDDDGGTIMAPRPNQRDAGDEPDAMMPMTPIDRPPPLDAGDGKTGACAVEDTEVFEVTTRGGIPLPTPLSVDQIESRFGMAYVGPSPDCLDALYLSHMRGPYGSGEPEQIVALDSCSLLSDPAVAHTREAWLLGVVDNRKDGYDVWVHTYSVTDEELGEGYRVSDGEGKESALALGTSADDALAVWAERNGTGSLSSIHARVLDQTGEPTGDIVLLEESNTLSYVESSVTSLGEGWAVVYRRFDQEVSELVLQYLDEEGKPVRDPWVWNGEAGPDANGFVVGGLVDGAAVYGIQVAGSGRQVFFQYLGPDGEAGDQSIGAVDRGPTAERRLVGPPLRAVDVSATRMPTGYAVAYRLLPGGDETEAKIRVVFLDRFGAFLGDSDVALATEIGGRTAIVAATDGRVVVGWTDFEDGESLTRMARLPCIGR